MDPYGGSLPPKEVKNVRSLKKILTTPWEGHYTLKYIYKVTLMGFNKAEANKYYKSSTLQKDQSTWNYCIVHWLVVSNYLKGIHQA